MLDAMAKARAGRTGCRAAAGSVGATVAAAVARAAIRACHRAVAPAAAARSAGWPIVWCASMRRSRRSSKGLRCHDAFCCLGTTMRDAGSQDGVSRRRSGPGARVRARRARRGAERLVVVSAVGANAASKNFYLRVKGRDREGAGAAAFAALDILQPSVLLGSRRGVRPLELLAQAGMWLRQSAAAGRAGRVIAAIAADVAAAMWERRPAGGAACTATPMTASSPWRATLAPLCSASVTQFALIPLK